jgi:hypothetical protein
MVPEAPWLESGRIECRRQSNFVLLATWSLRFQQPDETTASLPSQVKTGILQIAEVLGDISFRTVVSQRPFSSFFNFILSSCSSRA